MSSRTSAVTARPTAPDSTFERARAACAVAVASEVRTEAHSPAVRPAPAERSASRRAVASVRSRCASRNTLLALR